MQYQVIPPPPSLNRYVKYFWTASINPLSIAQYKLRTMVDDSSGMIFQRRVNQSAILTKGELIPKAFLYGQITGPTSSECLEEFSCVGVLFHPHTSHELFSFNSSILTDRMVDSNDIPGMKSLSEAILNTDCTFQAINLMVEYLERLISSVKGKEVLSRDVISYIRSHLGLVRVQEIKEYFKISERMLERHFLNQVGVNPRHFIQVTRFHEVTRRLRMQGNDRLIDIAYDLNFSDQSHFNSLIRKFANCAPRKLRSSLEKNIVNVFLYSDT